MNRYQRRLNQMHFCTCHHGQGAHRNGTGPCVGELRVAGAWVSCPCDTFVEAPEPAEEQQ